jgi:hypothetical protein
LNTSPSVNESNAKPELLLPALPVPLAHAKDFASRNGGNTLRPIALSSLFWILTAVFAFTLVDNVRERPDGVIIAGIFTILIIALSAFSRYQRSTELRVSELVLADKESVSLWPLLVGKKVNAVPSRTDSPDARMRKAQEIRKYYDIKGPLAFIHVSLTDNRSDFLARLKLKIRREGDDFVIGLSGAVAVANTIAYLSELIDPISLFLGLSRQNLMAQSARYLIFGEGEVGLMVYKILLRYWDWTPEDDVRPLIFLMSE